MKKIVLLAAVLVSTLSIAQERITEGKVITKQVMSSPDAEMSMQLAMLGEMVSTTYFKGAKSRTESNNPMTGNNTIVLDLDSKDVLVVMDNPMVGKKYATKKIENIEEMLKDLVVEATTETKKFLGYDCKKYIVKSKLQGQDVTTIVYATEQLPAIGEGSIEFGGKIKGFELYSEKTMQQMGKEITIKKTVSEIKKETVSDDKFSMTPPAGYEKQEAQAGM